MTKIILNPQIGQAVYRSFSPQTVGVIRSIRATKSWGADVFFVSVEWITQKGKTSIEGNIDSTNLSSLDWLIAEHQKKLSTHLAAKKRLQTLTKGKK